MESKPSLSFFFFIILLCCVVSSQAYDFLVGGRDGWVLRPSESYDSWAQRMRFQVNDTLVFRYQNGTDSVLSVNRQDYDTCNIANPILRMEGGNSRYLLERSGPFYFITGNQANCQGGQKLILIVMAPRTPPRPIPTPATPPGTAPSPQVQPPTGATPPGTAPSPQVQPPSGVAPTTPPGSPQVQPPSGVAPTTPPGSPQVQPPSGDVAPTPPSGSEGPSGGGGGGSDGGGGAGDQVPTPPGSPPSSSPALLSSMGFSVLVIMVWGSFVGTF